MMNKKRHGFVRILAVTALSVIAVYVVYSIINDSIAIRENQRQYEDLKSQTESVEDQNEQIQAYLNDDTYLDKYIEEMARDKLDYANSNERIYYVIPASAE